MDISIHAPRTGSDMADSHSRMRRMIFQSTLPARGATSKTRRAASMCRISIHAPRTGSDLTASTAGTLTANFNPRSPHGERLSPASFLVDFLHFNPRSPHGERHLRNSPISRQKCISIHAPRTGSDVLVRIIEINAPISIHAPRTGSDGLESVYNDHVYKFQSTLPARGATVPAPC